MKLIIKAVCISFVLTVVYSMIPFHAECRCISDDTFRLHILANSDSEADQSLKLKVRDRVLEYTEELFESAPDKNAAESAVRDNLQSIANIAYGEVLRSGFDYPVRAEVTRMYFTTRYYDNYTLPSGMYDALRISIGAAEGHNWWCVMYPSICLSSATEREDRAKQVYSDSEYEIVADEKYEYKFKVVELFEQLKALFG
ncbi:stage II sporulation protein R [Ruminococcus sp.]|uniref:stage II sporulation protein R n=1 Tax=Ruminococcus sp. TaxID=41978 RepID=UPI002E762E61|nr:stage II sporulation protein R [Ruminococcus sp.]MEE1261597.1 stage II sporulation protein R [Ruminococcus sp.]